MDNNESSAEGQPNRHEFVSPANLVEVAGQGPRGSIGVVGLQSCTAP